MPTKKGAHVDKVLSLMTVLPRVRNCSIIGHVDHGKTTLSDSLLAYSGLLNPQLAGQALLLDYLDEEQTRGITIKTANVSLVFDHGGQDLLVNLVDTPGHVDFSGKVTRALRLIDTAIVVVDAVEGVMIQTEHVVRQALENAVRPLLYINKIDRLIKELHLDAKQVQQRFKAIIEAFNSLVESRNLGGVEQGWKVDMSADTVAFGSATDGWGATLSQFLKRYRAFGDIIQAYGDEVAGKGPLKALKEALPLHSAIVEMLVKHGPDPVHAQAYRMPFIWRGSPSSDIGEAAAACIAGATTLVFVSRVQIDHGQAIATGRVFSGTLKQGDELYLIRACSKERVDSIGVFMGQRIIQVDSVPAGNVVAIKGLKDVKAGETLVSAAYAGNERDVAFDPMSYLMEPVVTVSIEPERLADLKKLEAMLELKVIEDPNLRIEESTQTGEILISGIGPLHLDVITNEIKAAGIAVMVSEPITMYHESIEAPSKPHAATSTNGKDKIVLRVEPLSQPDVNALKAARVGGERGEVSKHAREALKRAGLSWRDEEVDGLVAVCRGTIPVIYLPAKGAKSHTLPQGDEQSIADALGSIARHGPLLKESMSSVKVVVEEATFSAKAEERDPIEITPMIRQALFDAMNEAGVVLLEPIFESAIYGAVENIGKLTSLVAQHGGRIEAMEQDGTAIKLRAYFPVRESFGLIEEARNITSGRAVFQNAFAGFERVQKGMLGGIVAGLKEKKGLV
ncbi:MAG: GTP-binding protein [Candidatus Lokiarchaeota archaeon]|nr:GTP-binding protein [Candidatus Lokiarchaeota archaeon]